MAKRKDWPVNTGSQECKREAYRRAHHAAKIQVFLEAMLGLTPLEVKRIPFGNIVTALKQIAADAITADEAADYLRRSGRKV